jgi:heme-degrading monooxygenase HmoA
MTACYCPAAKSGQGKYQFVITVRPKGKGMIARIWHGVTLATKSEQYMDYLNRTGIPDYRKTPGNRGVYVLRRFEGDHAHFTLISLWDSMDAIRSFAGTDVEKARYYPEDRDYLLELEPTVQHYDVLARP